MSTKDGLESLQCRSVGQSDPGVGGKEGGSTGWGCSREDFRVKDLEHVHDNSL